MKHIFNTFINCEEVGIAVAPSVDWEPDEEVAQYFCLFYEDSGDEVPGTNGCPSEEAAINAAFLLFPDNDY